MVIAHVTVCLIQGSIFLIMVLPTPLAKKENSNQRISDGRDVNLPMKLVKNKFEIYLKCVPLNFISLDMNLISDIEAQRLQILMKKATFYN